MQYPQSGPRDGFGAGHKKMIPCTSCRMFWRCCAVIKVIL